MDEKQQPTSNDEAILQMLAGANFGPNSSLTLPSGKKLNASEAQTWTSVYADDSENAGEQNEEPEPKRRGWFRKSR